MDGRDAGHDRERVHEQVLMDGEGVSMDDVEVPRRTMSRVSRYEWCLEARCYLEGVWMDGRDAGHDRERVHEQIQMDGEGV